MLGLVVAFLLTYTFANEQTQKLRIEGEEAFKGRRYGDAVKFFTQAIELEPSDVHYHRRGLVYLSQDKIPLALSDFTKSLEFNPKYKFALKERSRSYVLKGDFEKAVKDLQVLVDLGDTESQEKVKTARSNLRLQQSVQNDIEDEDCNPDSVQTCKNIIVSSPFDRKCGYFVSMCLMVFRDYQEVMIYTGKLLKINSRDVDAMVIRAKAYLYIDEFNMVGKHVKAGLSVDSSHRDMGLFKKKWRIMKKSQERVEKSMKKKRWQSVHSDYKELATLFPHYESFVDKAYTNICLAARRARTKFSLDYRVQVCTRAVEYKNSAEAYAERGRLYFGESKWEESVRDWGKAVQKDQQNRQYNDEMQKAQRELKKSKRKDYYKVLDTKKHATDKEIKKAFRKCAVKFHPDKFARKAEEEKSVAEDKYKECVEAQDILSNADLRRRYDNGEDVLETLQGGNRQNHGGGGFPFHFFRHGGGHGGGQKFRFN